MKFNLWSPANADSPRSSNYFLESQPLNVWRGSPKDGLAGRSRSSFVERQQAISRSRNPWLNLARIWTIVGAGHILKAQNHGGAREPEIFRGVFKVHSVLALLAFLIAALVLPVFGARPINVSVSPSAVTLTAGQTQQFSATVTATGNAAVTWSLNSLAGSISPAGLFTAPSSISNAQSVTVTATSVADPTKSASASVTLNPPVTVSVTPQTASLTASQTQQFSAIVTGSNKTSVSWSASPVGTISKAGLYTAPSSISAAQSVTLTATSVADPAKSASATVTLNAPVTASVTLQTTSLPGGTVNLGYSAALSATGGAAPYTWSAAGLPSVIAVSGSSLAGTPTVAGSFSVTLTVRDNTGKTSSSTLPLSVAAPPPPPNTISDDEFVGPFASWTNLKAAYGAKGDGVTDDTAAINKALADLGTSGHSHTLYVNCGTYQVTGLQSPPHQGIRVLGEDPSCVTFHWAGPATVGPLLFVNGDDYSEFSRITFDGAGNTSLILVEQSSVGPGAFFDTGNEYADDVFQNAGVGIRCGALANGCSEMSVLRDHFTNLASVGVVTGNYNALDIWVRYSVFDHCGNGVGDDVIMVDGTEFNGAGNFHIYNSIFRYSTHYDVAMGNVAPFSFRDNYFIGSPEAIHGAFSSNAAPMTIAGNIFIDNSGMPVDISNQGPVILLDNVFRSLAGATTPIATGGWDTIAAGNTFTVGPTPIRTVQRLFEADTQIVDPSTINAAEPVLPGVAPNLQRAIIEVAAGASPAAIQQAINTAAAQGSTVVHLAEGQYSISAPLSIPANSDIELIGDGFFATQLNWAGGTTGPVVLINGPSHATLREFKIGVDMTVDAIGAYNVDQPGSRVFLHATQLGADNTNTISDLFYDGLASLNVEAQDIGHTSTNGSGIKVVAAAPATGTVRIYSGSSAGEVLPYEVTSGNLLVRDTWNEHPGPASLKVSGIANVTMDGDWTALASTAQTTPGADISNLNGLVSVIASELSDRLVISGNGTSSQVLQAGGSNLCPVVDPYFIDQANPTGVFGLLISRECTRSVPGTGAIATPDMGNTDPTFVKAMLAQTRAAHQAPLTSLPAGVTDLRLYRLCLDKGISNLHLASAQQNLR
jgi:hypothetical protein